MARGPDLAKPRLAPAGHGPLGEDARRAVSALLRERARRLPRVLPPRVAAGARLLPVLLHASFERAGVRGDAPGLAGLRYRRGWASLARAFGLPPPHRAQRGRCAAEALLALPGPAGLDALVLVRRDLPIEDLGRLQERLEAAEQLLAAGGAAVRAVIYDPARLEHDLEVAQRAMAFGALLGGRLSPEAWASLETTRRPLPALTASALAVQANLPAATLALSLMARARGPGPLDAAVALLAHGVPLRRLAGTEAFCLGWAGLFPGLGAPLEEAVRLARGGAELGRLLEHGRALALACARAIRASRLGHIDRSSQRLWLEALGPGLPRLLLPALGASLAELAAAGQLRLEPMRAARGYEVRLRGGEVLGRGASPVQARLRAVAIVAAADAARPPAARAAAPLHAALDEDWRELALRVVRPRDEPALLLLPIAGGAARPGPPLDLLNRGPGRALELDGALAVRAVPGRRPSGRLLAAGEAVRAVLARAQAGASLEIVASRSAARPVAARLAQVAALLRDPSFPGPAAIEAGGEVLLTLGRGVRVYPLARFAARPRVFTPDPHAPDISISTGERRAFRARDPGVLQCRVSLAQDGGAALLYADASGGHLREEVALADLEERLREARALVRGGTPPASLAVRLSEDLEAAVRRAGPPGRKAPIAVRGALPWVEVEIEGERFGGRSRLGWGAAAEALLSRWSAGAEGLVAVSAVAVEARGAPASPLLALYAAGLARRRLRTHLRRALAAYRTAATRRREG
ncbi:hypothetical protein [Anaeromyxobacter diazotrophicus]|uniref:Uncharacterized protein n=1 Tax=Anaeromyxobacter diazotrophicus TaxID=2590199 RepID=A0A7I9VRV4_9BACT|nr:hypothetical protein [Anaeromyxobacter diazotrophicus]GEJ59174.1 hypothetical protein AMYX_39150 [Anaeromyxobacter diazotrophicus]